MAPEGSRLGLRRLGESGEGVPLLRHLPSFGPLLEKASPRPSRSTATRFALVDLASRIECFHLYPPSLGSVDLTGASFGHPSAVHRQPPLKHLPVAPHEDTVAHIPQLP